MTTRGVLVAARALIATPDQWVRGCYSTDDGAFCAWGAIDTASRTAEDAGDWIAARIAREAAAGLVRAAAGVPDLPPWNDAPERTHAEVLAAFDRAIEACS